MTHTQVIDPKKWVSSYADSLYGFAIARIDDESLAKDLVQETFLAALEKLDQFEGRSSERTWLMAIMRNKIIDVYRKRSSALHSSIHNVEQLDGDDFFEVENGHWKEEHQPRTFGIEQYDRLANKELTLTLDQCMKKLPALWLSVFTMRHIDELTTEVICGHLKVSSSNFWVIIHRTKVSLRACLQKNWYFNG